MIHQLNRIQSNSQTPSHVKITKRLNTSQLTSRIIDVKHTRDQQLRFEEKLARLSSNIHDKKNEVFR